MRPTIRLSAISRDAATRLGVAASVKSGVQPGRIRDPGFLLALARSMRKAADRLELEAVMAFKKGGKGKGGKGKGKGC